MKNRKVSLQHMLSEKPERCSKSPLCTQLIQPYAPRGS